MDNYLGEIRMVGFSFAPVGWLLCNGQTLPISSYQALFALLGTTFGGNGTSNFQLPDLQGRIPIHVGNGTGLPPYTWGEHGGSNAATVPLPAHTHTATFTPSGSGTPATVTVTVQGSSAAGTTTAPTGNYLAGTPKGLADGLYVPAPAATTLGNIAGVSGTINGGTSSGGTVAVVPSGVSPATITVQPPFLAVYFIIAYQGIYPTRE